MVSFAEPMKIEVKLKNTFVHFDVTGEESDSSPMPLRPESTCPDIIQQHLFRTKSLQRREDAEQKAKLHNAGECRPCAYFAFKKDGCRLAEDCEFCHLCDRAEIRRWKRQRAKALKGDGEIEDFKEMDSRSARAPSAVTTYEF